MTEEVKPNPQEASTQDAQLAAERIAAGEEKAPQVDIEGDYEASKAFSVSQIDRTGEGAQAAEAATAPQYEMSQSEETNYVAEPTGNPADYRDMAKDVNPRAGETTANPDALIEKALEMGKPGQ